MLIPRRIFLFAASRCVPLYSRNSSIPSGNLWHGLTSWSINSKRHSRPSSNDLLSKHPHGSSSSSRTPKNTRSRLGQLLLNCVHYTLLGSIAYSFFGPDTFKVVNIHYLTEEDISAIDLTDEDLSAIVTLRQIPRLQHLLGWIKLFDVKSTATDTALYDITVSKKALWYSPWRTGKKRPFTPLLLTNGLFPGEPDRDGVKRNSAGVIRIVVPDPHGEGFVWKQRVSIRRTKKTSVPKNLERVTIFASGTEGLAPALQIMHSLLARPESALAVDMVWHTAGWDAKHKGDAPAAGTFSTLDIFAQRELATLRSLHPTRLQIFLNQPHHPKLATLQMMGLERYRPSLRLWGMPSWSSPWSGSLFVAAGSAGFFKALRLPETGNLEYNYEMRKQIAKEVMGSQARKSSILGINHSRYQVLRLTDQQKP